MLLEKPISFPVSKEEEKILKILDLGRESEQSESIQESIQSKSQSVTQEESKQRRSTRFSQAFKHRFRSMRESYTENDTFSGFYYYEGDWWDYELIEASTRMLIVDDWYTTFSLFSLKAIKHTNPCDIR